MTVSLPGPPGLPCGCLSAKPLHSFSLRKMLQVEAMVSGHQAAGLLLPSTSALCWGLGAGVPLPDTTIGRRRIPCLGEQSTPAGPGTVSTWRVMAQRTGHPVPSPRRSQHKVITPTGQHMPGTQCLPSSSPQLSAQG